VARPDFDILVVGGGSAGLTVSIAGRALGMRVAQVERYRMGGECLGTGCVPSKALLHAAALAHAAREAAEAGLVEADPAAPIDFGRAMAHVQAAIETIAPHDSAQAQGRRGIKVFDAHATLLGGGRVQVGAQTVTARHIVLCTGSRPRIPDVPGMDQLVYHTHETIFGLTHLPGQLAIIGGGPEGCELAQAFARLGSRVVLIQRNRRLLANDDEEASALIRTVLEREGVTVLTSALLKRVVPSDVHHARLLHVDVNGQEHTIEADAVLVAAGREPVVDGLGLDEAGVKVGPDGIVVDAYMRTTAPGIWACGDCVGPYRYTHAAETQGRQLVRNLLFPWKMRPIDLRGLPWATFTDPESAHVGLTEAAARSKYGKGAIRTVLLPLSEVDRAVCEGATDGFVKYTLRGQKLVGAQVVAPRAGELIQQLALLLHQRLPRHVLESAHVYPTYSYALHQANDRANYVRRSESRVWSFTLRVLRRFALGA